MIQVHIQQFYTFLKRKGCMNEYEESYSDALNTWHMEDPLRIFLYKVSPLMAIRAAFRWDNEPDRYDFWLQLNKEWEKECFDLGIVQSGKGWNNIELEFYQYACNVHYGINKQAIDPFIPSLQADKLRFGSLNMALYVSKGILPKEVLTDEVVEKARHLYYDTPNTEEITIRHETRAQRVSYARDKDFSITNRKALKRVCLSCALSEKAKALGFTNLTFAKSDKGSVYLVLSKDSKGFKPSNVNALNLCYNSTELLRQITPYFDIHPESYQQYELGTLVRTSSEKREALIYKVVLD